MASRAYTQGANARAQSWDEVYEERGQGNWLPLEALDDELYMGTPRLEALRSPRPERAEPIRRTAPHVMRAARQARAQAAAAQAAPGQKVVQVRGLAALAGIAFTALAAYVLFSMALEWAQVKLDDLQYGRPRTFQMDAYVGHNEAEGLPSHFIAMNLNRRVTIMELPGGNSTQAKTIVGPYLFGQGEDLTPVQLDARDLNTDGRADLIVSVKSEQLIYVNEGESFRLMTPEEQAALRQTLQRPPQEPESGVEEAGK
jgi:hypothetical protein